MAGVRLQDVAEHAGVSMKTVSNVVHEHPHVSRAMRERVQKAIDELGYRPNALGRRLATGRTGLLALAFADVRLPYFSELANLVSRAAAQTSPGYRLLLEETEGTLEGERAVLSASEAGLVDGMLFQPSQISSREIAERHGDLPMVLLGEGPAPLSMDRVMIDNVSAAAAATRHLVALGRRRIAFLGHEAQALSSTSRLRIVGYQEGLEQSGLSPDPSLLIASDEITPAASAVSLGAAIDAGLEIDGVVCRDDLAAMGALRALQERGLTHSRRCRDRGLGQHLVHRDDLSEHHVDRARPRRPRPRGPRDAGRTHRRVRRARSAPSGRLRARRPRERAARHRLSIRPQPQAVEPDRVMFRIYSAVNLLP